ncbi:uncharacterized protein [Solanum lycopersicum]|uniref:uncharacterized protein n=1 Tax=Solanum lycopersicum TaxID=4081 RepID=UPI003749B593
MWGQWERLKAIVLSWLMNVVSKSLLSDIAFSSSAFDVWTDLKERFDRVDGSRTYSLHKDIATLQPGSVSTSMYYKTEKQKLYQFLMGLNESYHQARSQMLMMDPLPSINYAYARIVGDENQKVVVNGVNDIFAALESLVALYSKKFEPAVCNTANTTGKTSFVSEHSNIWIIDTSATNHMVSSLNILNKNIVHELEVSKPLYLPNGTTTQELYNGKVKEVGKEEGGLYLLIKHLTTQCTGQEKEVETAFVAHDVKEADMVLWHKRLGHVSSTQNGVVERKHRHLLEDTRALRLQAHIPIRYWGHCLLAAAYIINRLPFSVLKFDTPYERLYGVKPSVSHVKTLGYLCFAKLLTEHDNLMARSRLTVPAKGIYTS